MDPNLFHLDWERTLEALVGIVILSFLVERAGALLFESRWWISRLEDARVGKPPAENPAKQPPAGGPKAGATAGAGGEAQEQGPAGNEEEKALPARKYPLKELLAFALAFAICWVWHFDAVSIILLSEHTKLAGIIVTAAVVAGGSKASISLFHRLLGIMSNAEDERRKLKKLTEQE